MKLFLTLSIALGTSIALYAQPADICPPNFTLNNYTAGPTEVTGGDVQDYIILTNVVIQGTGTSGAYANFNAGNTIFIGPNSHIQQGVDFLAKIQSCDDPTGRAAKARQAVKVAPADVILTQDAVYKSITINIADKYISSITLYTIDGKQVAITKSPNYDDFVVLDTSSYSSGIYVATITTTDGQAFQKKIIIQ